jgi:hypothetical protein
MDYDQDMYTRNWIGNETAANRYQEFTHHLLTCDDALSVDGCECGKLFGSALQSIRVEDPYASRVK